MKDSESAPHKFHVLISHQMYKSLRTIKATSTLQTASNVQRSYTNLRRGSRNDAIEPNYSPPVMLTINPTVLSLTRRATNSQPSDTVSHSSKKALKKQIWAENIGCRASGCLEAFIAPSKSRQRSRKQPKKDGMVKLTVRSDGMAAVAVDKRARRYWLRRRARLRKE